MSKKKVSTRPYTRAQRSAIFDALVRAGLVGPTEVEREEAERLRASAWAAVEAFLARHWPEHVRPAFRLFGEAYLVQRVYLPGLTYDQSLPVGACPLSEFGHAEASKLERVEVPRPLAYGVSVRNGWGLLGEHLRAVTESSAAWAEHQRGVVRTVRLRRVAVTDLLRDLPAVRFLAEAPPEWRPVIETSLRDFPGAAPPPTRSEVWKLLF